jgi:branched-chain amino acid transport system ATP-binding protein
VSVLTVEGLHSYYGQAHILADVALSVDAGETVVLLGRNGAGKSTTLKSIIGLVTPRRGSVRFRQQNIAGLAPHRVARLGIGYVPEDRRVFARLTVAENLETGRQPARADGPRPWTPERLYALFPNLLEARQRPAAQMSGGEQQMLTIARTLMGNPAVILLDEPSEGLAPVIVQQMAQTVQRLKQEGLAVLLSEQNLHFANAVSDRAYVIESGRIRYQGSIAALNADADVRRDYLSL